MWQPDVQVRRMSVASGEWFIYTFHNSETTAPIGHPLIYTRVKQENIWTKVSLHAGTVQVLTPQWQPTGVQWVFS